MNRRHRVRDSTAGDAHRACGELRSGTMGVPAPQAIATVQAALAEVHLDLICLSTNSGRTDIRRRERNVLPEILHAKGLFPYGILSP